MNHWGKNIPVFITENGIADKSDKYSAPFTVSHIRQIRQAIDNGANVIGYYIGLLWIINFVWCESVINNFSDVSTT